MTVRVPANAIGLDLAAGKRLSAALHAAGLLERSTNIGELECVFAQAFAEHREAVERLRAPIVKVSSKKGGR